MVVVLGKGERRKNATKKRWSACKITTLKKIVLLLDRFSGVRMFESFIPIPRMGYVFVIWLDYDGECGSDCECGGDGECGGGGADDNEFR